jgi:hypothetical protein
VGPAPSGTIVSYDALRRQRLRPFSVRKRGEKAGPPIMSGAIVGVESAVESDRDFGLSRRGKRFSFSRQLVTVCSSLDRSPPGVDLPLSRPKVRA